MNLKPFARIKPAARLAPQAGAKRQRGYGLIEVMLSLVIIAVLVAIAVAVSVSLRTSVSINNNVSAISQIAANAKKTFGFNNQYVTVTYARAVRSIVPSELRPYNGTTKQLDDTAFNPFGGEIPIGYSYLTAAGDTLAFVWQAVPRDQCEGIVSQVAGLMRRIDIENPPTKVYKSPDDLGSSPLFQSGGSGPTGVAATMTKTLKAADAQLDPGALNDACNGVTTTGAATSSSTTSNTVNLWFWVGRS
jgi:prepilin-type N-terminal cleavage/methylation domain-containing protein